MLNEWLMVSYKHETKEAADRAYTEKLKRLPVDELSKLASGDPTSKLAYALADCSSGGPVAWLDKYKNSPLFQKAVELERQLLQLDAEDQEKRKADAAESQGRWDLRDKIRLEQRMLDLDLALEQSGGSASSEQKEEQGIQMLEQAQAEERAAGEGGEPHEQAEDAAIRQFRQAQSQEAAAKAQEPPKPKEEKPNGMSVEVKSAASINEVLVSSGAKTLGRGLKGVVKDHFHTPAGAITAGALGVTAGKALGGRKKEATALFAASERHAPGPNTDTIHSGRQGASVVGDYIPDERDSFDTVTAGKQASVKVAGALDVGRFLAKQAYSSAYGSPEEAEAMAGALEQEAAQQKANPKLERLKGGLGGGLLGGLTGLGAATALRPNDPKAALVGSLIGAGGGGLAGALSQPGAATAREARALRSLLAPEALAAESKDLRETADHVDASPGTYRARRALGGGLAGAGLGALVGGLAKKPGIGALAGGALGAGLSALPRPSGAPFREDADKIDAHLKKKAEALDANKVRADVAKKYPGLQKKAFLGTIAKGAPAALAGAKSALGGAKSLAQTAYQSGGMGQVAKSFGNVAKNFAQKNPLAAAGIAGGAGLVAGRALGQ